MGKKVRKNKPFTKSFQKKTSGLPWLQMRTEWIEKNIATGITLNKFREEKNIGSRSIFFRHVREEAWVKKRDEILNKAIKNTEKRIGEKVEDKFDLQAKIYDAGERQVDYWLGKNVVNGKIVSPVDPHELVAVMKSAITALHAKRLMLGKSTEIVEDRSIVIQALLKLQEDIKKNNPEVLNSTHTIQNFDKEFDSVLGARE